jgi:hypothetical protein
MLGSATIVSGVVKLDSFHLADGTNDARLAKVDASGNVAVSVNNSPSVSISGTPTVEVSHQPFPQFVLASSDGVGESCDEIDIPAGMRLTIESFSADAQGLSKPTVYLMTLASTPTSSHSVRTIVLELRPRESGWWGGDARTLLVSGADVDPNGWSFSCRACVCGPGSFRGFVTGYLDPLP